MTPTQRHITRLVSRVAALYELTPSDVLAEGSAKLSQYEARRLVYLVAQVGLGLSTTLIGEAVGDSHTSVRHHIKRAIAQTKSSKVFKATYRAVLKETEREFAKFGLELPESAE